MIAIKSAAIPESPERTSEFERVLEVVVIFTAPAYTAAALSTAVCLAQGLDARVRFIVPRIVPFPLQLDQSPVDREVNEQRFLSLLPKSPVAVWLDVRLCRDLDAIPAVLAPRSLVVLGVRNRWWAPGDRRLARMLSAAGHQVMLAERQGALHA